MARKSKSPKVKLTKNQQLLQRIRTECKLDLPVGAEIFRTYAGKNQKEAWAWSWSCYGVGTTSIGSIFTVTELLREKTLVARFTREGAAQYVHIQGS